MIKKRERERRKCEGKEEGKGRKRKCYDGSFNEKKRPCYKCCLSSREHTGIWDVARERERERGKQKRSDRFILLGYSSVRDGICWLLKDYQSVLLLLFFERERVLVPVSFE